MMLICESEQQKTPKYMLISPRLNQFLPEKANNAI